MERLAEKEKRPKGERKKGADEERGNERKSSDGKKKEKERAHDWPEGEGEWCAVERIGRGKEEEESLEVEKVEDEEVEKEEKQEEYAARA